MDNEVAFTFIALVQILFWSDLKNIIAHLKADWLNFLSDILAWLLNMTECLVSFAIQLWKAGGPLLPDLLEDIWWDRELGTSCVYDGGIA